MATLTVTTAADVVNAADGVLSLREAVVQANAAGAPDTIVFAGALEGRTLTLTQGQLALGTDVSIDGDRNDDGTEVHLTAGDDSRCMVVRPSGADVTLEDLHISDGRAPENQDGGGIFVSSGSTLALTGCLVENNNAGDTPTFSSSGRGGAVFADTDCRIFVSECVIRGNVGASSGGGIYAAQGSVVSFDRTDISSNTSSFGGGIFSRGATLTLQRSTVSGNRAFEYKDGGGGGISIDGGRATIAGSTIADNDGALNGGGIRLESGVLSVANTTIAGNAAVSDIGVYAGSGGAILAERGVLSVTGCTITNNYAYSTAGLYEVGGGIDASDQVQLSIANTIVAGNVRGYDGRTFTPADLEGTIGSSNGHNIFGSDVAGAVTGDLENVAPSRLFAVLDPDTGGGTLAVNGGPTRTVALRNAANNPALSGAEPVAAGDGDQRGFARPAPAASNPDVGAFELAQAALSRSPTAGNDVLTGSAAANSLNGLAGADLLRGLGGDDALNGGEGGDTLRGGVGDDALNGQVGQDTASYRDATGAVTVSLAAGTSSGALGADTLSGIENLEGGSAGDRLTGNTLTNALGGRQGADRLFGLAGNDRLFGGAGDDLLEGGLGSDRLDGGGGVDQVSWFNDGGPSGLDLNLATGIATRGGERDLLAGIEDVDGTNNADALRGDGGANRLGGAGGADQLFGRSGDDQLLGALGNDRLNGALGRDTQTGGAGADLFDFDRLADSTVGASRDVIIDFAHLTDRIDLATIDARSATAANEAFAFRAVEGAAFTGAGQVRWFQEGGDTFVEANVDANLAADFQVQLTGLKTLTAGDFVL